MTIIKQSREFTKQEIYKLTHNRSSSIKDCLERSITANDWLFYTDVNSKGLEVNVLVVSADDGLYSTISPTFINEFLDMTDAFDLPLRVNVVGGTTKAGREFVSCELA